MDIVDSAIAFVIMTALSFFAISKAYGTKSLSIKRFVFVGSVYIPPPSLASNP